MIIQTCDQIIIIHVVVVVVTCGEDLLQVQHGVDQGVGVVGPARTPVDRGQQRPRQDAAGTCRTRAA